MLKRNKLKVASAVILLMALLLGGCKKQIIPQGVPAMLVSFVDVGQGDGILIECEDIVIAIDGGEEENTYKFNTYLKSRGITAIDYYIVTHPHSDHIGAVPAIFGLYEVKNCLIPEFSEINMPTTKMYENLLTAVASENCAVSSPKPGDTVKTGKLKLEFFAPVEETANYNDMSLVFKATYGKTSFLFVGDAEKQSEALMLKNRGDLKADVLKVGHHGSSSSSSVAFIDAVSPAYAVISCGKNNDYGHPEAEVVKALENRGTKVFRTDINGTVKIYSDGEKIITE